MASGSRRRDSSMIWPGFVDAVTTLLMVLMFVLTIFTIMQSILREQITTQDSELSDLTAQVADLADALAAKYGTLRGDAMELHNAQVVWAREQAADFQAYLRRAKDPAAVIEGDWPVLPPRD